MNFTRKKRRGRTQDQYQEWLSDDGHYRITWSSMFPDRDMPDTFYACVLTVRHHKRDDYEYWNFAGKRGPYRTFKKAQEACEKHLKAWEAFFKIMAGPYKGRADRVRELVAKTTVGTDETVHKILSSLPKWVRDQASPDQYRILFDAKRRNDDEDSDECPQSTETTDLAGQSDPTPILPTIEDEPAKAISLPSDISPKMRKRGPAPVATDGAGPTTKGRRSSSRKADETVPESPATNAKARVSARRNPANEPTKPRSSSGRKKRTATTIS